MDSFYKVAVFLLVLLFDNHKKKKIFSNALNPEAVICARLRVLFIKLKKHIYKARIIQDTNNTKLTNRWDGMLPQYDNRWDGILPEYRSIKNDCSL